MPTTNRAAHHDHAPVVTFTPAGHAALDALAETIVNRMGQTPEEIATVLEEVLHAPIDALTEAFTVIAAELDQRRHRSADKPADTDVVWADGWRTQLPGYWPYYPHEPHHCYPAGHWTRDGRLVLACCGLDAT